MPEEGLRWHPVPGIEGADAEIGIWGAVLGELEEIGGGFQRGFCEIEKVFEG